MSGRMDSLKGLIRDALPENKALRGKCDSQAICDELGVDMDELTYVMFRVLDKAFNSMYKSSSDNERLVRDNLFLQKSLESKYQGNKRDMQAAKVSAGLPIARKQKKNLADLKFQMYLKLSDKQLMEYFGISKTTLWRWKKELAEREVNGQMPF
jgi:hypothetical protein